MIHTQRVVALKWASVVVIGFGLACTLAVFTPVARVLDLFLQFATLSSGEIAVLDSVEGRLVTAILGGITAGWGVMIWMITTRVYAKDPALGGPLIVIPTCFWFVIDSFGSVLSGAPFNVVLNLTFLAILVLPVVWKRQGAAVAT